MRCITYQTDDPLADHSYVVTQRRKEGKYESEKTEFFSMVQRVWPLAERTCSVCRGGPQRGWARLAHEPSSRTGCILCLHPHSLVRH